MSLFVERLSRSDPEASGSWGWLFGLLPLVAFGATGPLGLGLLLLLFGGVVGPPNCARRRDPLAITAGRVDREGGPPRGDRARPYEPDRGHRSGAVVLDQRADRCGSEQVSPALVAGERLEGCGPGLVGTARSSKDLG